MLVHNAGQEAHRRALLSAICLIALLITACSTPQAAFTSTQAPLHAISLGQGEKLKVVATISILGDVVRQVGGDNIDLTVLMGPGQDPHSYEPAASTARIIERAHVVFSNGFDLEESLVPLLDSVRDKVAIISASDGVVPISNPAFAEHGGVDPHVWQNPQNVMIWVDNIAKALSTLDPSNAASYESNAGKYKDQLTALDQEIEQRLSVIPADQRKLVTNHDALGYFAARYNFKVIGTVYLGGGEGAEPSAGQLAKLVETIKSENVNAIFMETTIGGQLAKTVAAEVGRPITVLTLYTDSLGPVGSPSGNYLGMMRANVDTILDGLAKP